MDVTFSYGIVIRRKALADRNINMQSIYNVFETTQAFSQSQDLICFGPHFGQEASDEMIRRLKQLGLDYVVDFYELAYDHPDWLIFSARLS